MNYANRGRLAALQAVERSGLTHYRDILMAEGLIELAGLIDHTYVTDPEWTKAPNKRPRKVAPGGETVTKKIQAYRLTLEGRLRRTELANDWKDYLEDHPHHVEIHHSTDAADEWHLLSRHETADAALEALRDDARYVAVIPPDEAEGVL